MLDVISEGRQPHEVDSVNGDMVWAQIRRNVPTSERQHRFRRRTIRQPAEHKTLVQTSSNNQDSQGYGSAMWFNALTFLNYGPSLHVLISWPTMMH
jgi:hypothetical protein